VVTAEQSIQTPAVIRSNFGAAIVGCRSFSGFSRRRKKPWQALPLAQGSALSLVVDCQEP
jgi:hypothetical protein